ncbi:LAETG motif-containing sortase-dependent surface protein [Streptomyces sp. NRRL F-2664]|uniref:LAETG motif-containing sortase-dependent surface protein n=1 Tax=Streptomyces sp. NRRL F-2664 TaxID=1463842 RepID=UPI0004CC0D67|nr:LAETG motif-containing sortase-dependent surface protein [Streptomyces sp. NRRL F-2664]
MSVRTAAAVAVVAGVVTTLLPLSATTASAAPAAGDHAVLRTEMGAPVPGGPLTRGGATETFDLTVENPTGKPVEYKPWLLLDPKGPSLLTEDDVVFSVEAVDAPATRSTVGLQDGDWQGMFAPSGAGFDQGFDIPANGRMTWKVTLGLGKNYPTNNGDFTFTATSHNNSVAPGGSDSHLFTVGPRTEAGALKSWFKQVSSGKDGQEQRAYLDLNHRATGDGVFNVPLATSLTLSHPGEQEADFRLQALIDGRWQDLKAEDGRYELPRIDKGFGAASGVHTQPLRLSLGKNTELKKRTLITMEAQVRQAEGNTWPLSTVPVLFPLVPITEPAPEPTTSPTTGTPSPSASPTSAPAARPAVATTSGNSAVTTTTGSATGSLAETGAGSSTGLYAGLAAVLVVLGAAAAVLGRRRRRTTA